GVGWDWSYMVNDEENHALVTDKKAPIEFALMANTSAESKVFDNFLCSKDCFQTASKDLDILLESQRLDKNKEGLGYSVVPPPPAQIYSPPKKDMSWTSLPEFKDDIVTDNSRHAPTVESSPDDAQKRNPSVTEIEASPSTISPKSFIKFIKANDSPTNRYISYLSDYEPFDRGYVSFGQGGCKITGKGTIKTGLFVYECVSLLKDVMSGHAPFIFDLIGLIWGLILNRRFLSCLGFICLTVSWTVICLYKLNKRFRCMPTIVSDNIILKLRETSLRHILLGRRIDLSRRRRNNTVS
nr:hypothetical protein [Tanacetum cinerariifolium]